MRQQTYVYYGSALGEYGFDDGHPFSKRRLNAFWNGMTESGLDHQVIIRPPVSATNDEIARFHSAEHIATVQHKSEQGYGYFDQGDTPVFKGAYHSATLVVGSTLDALSNIMSGDCLRAFVPIAGLHHARRDRSAGFCIFNDCGVAIETLRSCYNISKVAYVDIDAHHGDGVFYCFESDPQLFFADIHEDGHYLYPGTGDAQETGLGSAQGTKLNIPLAPGADDQSFLEAWNTVEQYLEKHQPEFILFQCGADSVNGDPLTHLKFSEASHAYAAKRLCQMADQYAQGRILAMGGGGYNLENISAAWTGVVRAFVENSGTSF